MVCAVESLKTAAVVEKKQKNKKLGKQEDFLKDTSRQLNMVKMKSNVVVSAKSYAHRTVCKDAFGAVLLPKCADGALIMYHASVRGFGERRLALCAQLAKDASKCNRAPAGNLHGLSLCAMLKIGRSYEGIPVAKLPFYPVGVVKHISHKGLPGDDLTDCSLVRALYSNGTFIY
eukprot:6076529-Pyramimonas_sp.AAC.1